MKSLNLIFAFILLAAFSITAPAQLCGYFGVTLDIHNAKLTAVNNASVKIIMPERKLPGKSYLRPEHQFVRAKGDKDGQLKLILTEGLELADDNKVVVSAPGYLPLEMMLSFPHCVRLTHDVTMLEAGEKKAVVSGSIKDENGKAVAYAGVHFVSAGGREKMVNADRHGHFELGLEPGDYTVESNLMYYHTTKVAKFTVPAGGTATLDLKMKTQSYNEDKQVIIQSISLISPTLRR
jgi:hypothetical protein